MSSSMVTVRLRRSNATTLQEALKQLGPLLWEQEIAALDAALRPKMRKPPKSILEAQTDKYRAKVTKREETRAIWEACWKRCGGRCECGCGGVVMRDVLSVERAELDHFFGRRGQQSERTCWILRSDSHREKTNNRPSAAEWLGRFIAHCQKYGYDVEARIARARLHGSVAVKADEKRRRSIR